MNTKTPSVAAADPADSSVQVVSLYQKTRKIYPRSVTGRFANWRWVLVWITQIVFYGLPWLMWGDRQALLLDIVSRRFYIFGLVLYPQDFIYLTALLLLSAYSLFLFTAVAGRLWCGYACPQTVYTEIFLWVERKIEGDRNVRMRRDAGPMTADKAWRMAAKQVVWIAIGLWTGFTLVGYFTPIHTLAAEVMSFGLGPWETFWILFYGFATYGNAGFMREQVCKYMCPYARFQSAMFDKDSLIITYDAARGEPRGPRSKKLDPKAAGLGACVDCGLCVQVCPTGIDIRKGLQYECIGCAACVDVCDEVMDRMQYPRGLVRYDTQNGLTQKGLTRGQLVRRVLRPRILIYTTILVLITTAVGISVATRTPFRANVVRDRGVMARQVEDGWLENVYRLQIMNAAEQTLTYRISAEGLPGLKQVETEAIILGPTEARWVAVALRVPPEAAAEKGPGVHEIHFTVKRDAVGAEGPLSVREKSTFVIPR
ncbi:MAG TPA: cytochrome c oxidase accessory protein CcoG [Rubrivivax sp.]|nr:cytochrome c oxidase accessory protein CcoG [Rubrivivax sp.]